MNTGAPSAALMEYPGERSNRPRLLDLFCGAGGAAMGYHRAGFEVVGMDIRPQPHYPFEFIQGDVLELFERGPVVGRMPRLPRQFDVIHASPPCQHYMRNGQIHANKLEYPDLLPSIRTHLMRIGRPWVIENVPGAPMRVDVVLCGSHFSLPVRRHRWFEASWPLPPFTLACDHSTPITGVYGHTHGKGGAWRNGKRPFLPSSLAMWKLGLGIDWMTARELTQAIPPAYTEWIGRQLMAYLTERREVAATG